MKILTTLVAICLYFSGFAQFKVKGTDGQTYTTLTQTQITNAIAAAIKPLADKNTAQDAQIKVLTDTLNWYKAAYNSLPNYGSTFSTINGVVEVNQTVLVKTADSVAKASTATLLTRVTNAENTGASNTIRIVSLEGARTSILLDVDKLKQDVLKIPTKTAPTTITIPSTILQ